LARPASEALAALSESTGAAPSDIPMNDGNAPTFFQTADADGALDFERGFAKNLPAVLKPAYFQASARFHGFAAAGTL
jgi:hypothetical protein